MTNNRMEQSPRRSATGSQELGAIATAETYPESLSLEQLIDRQKRLLSAAKTQADEAAILSAPIREALAQQELLTESDESIIAFIAQGLTIDEISKRMELTRGALKYSRSRILEKTGLEGDAKSLMPVLVKHVHTNGIMIFDAGEELESKTKRFQKLSKMEKVALDDISMGGVQRIGCN